MGLSSAFSFYARVDDEYRKKLGFTHTLSVCPGCQTPDDPKTLAITIEDGEFEDILAHFPKACAFIDEALQQEGAKVLVHCVMGISRSATIVAAYRES